MLNIVNQTTQSFTPVPHIST